LREGKGEVEGQPRLTIGGGRNHPAEIRWGIGVASGWTGKGEKPKNSPVVM